MTNSTGITIAACPGGDLALALGLCPDLFLKVATGPISVPPIWTCSLDFAAGPPVVGIFCSLPRTARFPLTFTGCAFADGSIPGGTTISIAVEGFGRPPTPPLRS